jgi:hydroxymethylbilane synthase
MRVGSRGSALARAQAEHVRELLGGGEIVVVTTSGDEGAVGDKSRWVDAIEQALLTRAIDLAVHSAKDVPGELAPGLALLGAPVRAPAEDALCGAGALDELREGARVGTSSLRRAAQLLAARPDLEIAPMRGNVDTRLSKLADGRLDAIVLARAGLSRLGRDREAGGLLDPAVFVPSPGQGTLALQGRVDDEAVARAASEITDEAAFSCLRAERALGRALQASCNTPLGAWCRPVEDRETTASAGAANARGDGAQEGRLRLRAWVGLPDGSAWISDELEGERSEPERLAERLAERMSSVGAREMLAQAEAVAR